MILNYKINNFVIEIKKLIIAMVRKVSAGLLLAQFNCGNNFEILLIFVLESSKFISQTHLTCVKSFITYITVSNKAISYVPYCVMN